MEIASQLDLGLDKLSPLLLIEMGGDESNNNPSKM